MKTFIVTILLLVICTMLLTSMKCKKDAQQPNKEQLPAVTQTGANTFAFLLNGEVWLPKGGLLDQNLDLSYDPTYKGGTLNIIAKRYFGSGSYQSISISSYNISSEGIYAIAIDKAVIYYNDTNSCTYHWNETSNTQIGTLTISKIDLTNKFISGTFEFKLEKQGCPTINATQGRFDLKIE